MLPWLLVLACAEPSSSPVAAVPTSPETSITSPSPPGPTGPAEIPCEPLTSDLGPDDVFTDGRRLRLEVAQLANDVALMVTRAEAGERILLHVGSAGALDCPVELDGACFLGEDSAVVGEVWADATGRAELVVPVDPAWSERWLLLQATAPDGCAISQGVVDRILADDWHEPLPSLGLPTWLPPITLLNQYGVEATFAWRAGPGRRAVITRSQGGWGQEGLRTTAVFEGQEVSSDTELVDEFWFPEPVTYYIRAYFEYDPSYDYSLDIDTLPLDAAVAWYVDGDGDGYGDGTGEVVMSRVPVPGASPATTDCDDGDAGVRPAAAETCGDGIDQDCDGVDRACAGTVPAEVGTRLAGPPLGQIGAWIATGDLDGDGLPEIVSGGDAVGVFDVTREDATWAFAVPHATGAVVGDVTGDAQPDLLLLQGYGASGMTAYAGPLGAAGLDAAPVAELLEDLWYPVGAIGDVTGDGIGDLVLTEGQGSVYTTHVSEGPLVGAIAFDQTLPPVTAAGGAHAVGDADGDGLDDIWTAEVCLYLTPIAVAGAVPIGCVDDGTTDAFGGKGMVSGDIDGDGLDDLTVGGAEGAYVLLGPLSGDLSVADGAWLKILDDEGGGQSEVATTPDRDGDGVPEVILSTESRVRAVSAASGGTLGHHDGEVLWTGLVSYGRATVLGGDLDADGVGDIIAAERDSSWDDSYEAGVLHLLWGQ